MLQLLSSRPLAQNIKVLKLFQYSYALFDNRFELNSNIKAIVEMTRTNISPQL